MIGIQAIHSSLTSFLVRQDTTMPIETPFYMCPQLLCAVYSWFVVPVHTTTYSKMLMSLHIELLKHLHVELMLSLAKNGYTKHAHTNYVTVTE